jgi:hypothetical protein
MLPDPGAFFGTNPQGASVTSGLPVIRPERCGDGCIAMMCTSRFTVSRVTLREELPPDQPLSLVARGA